MYFLLAKVIWLICVVDSPWLGDYVKEGTLFLNFAFLGYSRKALVWKLG